MDFNKILQGCSLGDYQIPLTPVHSLKNMTVSGRGIFALYGYTCSANFKKSSKNLFKRFQQNFTGLFFG